MPITTSWMGENNFESRTGALYGIILFCSALAYFILLRLIVKAHTNTDALSLPLKKQVRRGLFSTIGYLLAIALAFVHPALSGLIYLFIAIMWWQPDKRIEKTLEEHP